MCIVYEPVQNRVGKRRVRDYLNLDGRAGWYPGSLNPDEQGDGIFGFLPPADDAFYFIQMVREHLRLTGKPTLFLSTVQTPWGKQPLADVCRRAFDSVAVNADGCVVCEAEQGRTRVDWGFCDAIRKTGACLMPSLLRWRAATDLSELCTAAGDRESARTYVQEADRIRRAIPRTFLRDGVLQSATELGRQDDVWASAYAVWLRILPRDLAHRISRHLLSLYNAGGTVVEGQVRGLPPSGPYGGYWEKSLAAPDTYQNGAFWGTPSGWFIHALSTVDRHASSQMLDAFVAYLKTNRAKGAPWECINPAKNHYQNPLYCATVALPYTALSGRLPP